jgi:hypothetical protein
MRGPSGPRVHGPRPPRDPSLRMAHAAQLALVRAYVNADPATRRSLRDAAEAVARGSRTPGLAQAARGLLAL